MAWPNVMVSVFAPSEKSRCQVRSEVRVRTPDRVLTYEVTGVRIYRKARIARDAEQLFSQTRAGRLVLITCEDWNGSFYESNAVIFADRV